MTLTGTKVEDLKVGDTIAEQAVGCQAWKVISPPITSINQQLFWDAMGNTCVVVGVEYPDGARGSRLFAPGHTLTVNRPAQKD